MPTATIESLGKWVSDTYRDEAAKSLDFAPKFQATLDLCLSALGPHSSFTPTTWGVMGSKQALQIIQFCFSIRTHSEGLLVPILDALPNILRYKTYNSGVSIASRPFSDFACEVVRRFTRHVLGPKPACPVDLKTIGCGCNPCNKYLVPFFNGPNQRVRISADDKTRSHLSSRLATAQIWGVGWTTSQGKKGRGMQLQIDKPPHLVALGQWVATQDEGKRLLRLLGDVEQRKRILGPDYEWVEGAIAGTTVPPAVSSGNPSLKRPASDSNDEQVKRARVQ
ncbi:hypothetical protein PM082_003563 [Marasmius tenuissimus]|nr:hypothetical protein PM082_003563 [Marasmius tenuissimus]